MSPFFGRFVPTRKLLFSLRGSTYEPKSRIKSQQNITYHVKCETAKQRLQSDTKVSTPREEANVWTSVISVSDCGRARSGDNRAYCPKFRTPGTLADSRGSLFINPEHSSRTCCRGTRRDSCRVSEFNTQSEHLLL